MDERQRLAEEIRGIRCEDSILEYPTSCEQCVELLVDFVIKDRKRIIFPLIEAYKESTKNGLCVDGYYGENAPDLYFAIKETLKLAGAS